MRRLKISLGVSLLGEKIEEVGALLASALNRPVQELPQGLEFFVTPEEYPFLPDILREIPGMPASYNLSSEPYTEKNWETEWKRHLRPISIGRFTIRPSWVTEKPSDAETVTIALDPGMAFGTGHHETTRLCLEWLDAIAERARRPLATFSLLDVGTGSGILAIAAALVGFGSVIAVDVDAEAVRIARENAQRNDVLNRIHFVVGDLHALATSFHVVMANIEAHTLIALAPLLTAKVISSTEPPYGCIVLSGILQEHVTSVEAAYHLQGWTVTRRHTRHEWVLLELVPGRDDWI